MPSVKIKTATTTKSEGSTLNTGELGLDSAGKLFYGWNNKAVEVAKHSDVPTAWVADISLPNGTKLSTTAGGGGVGIHGGWTGYITLDNLGLTTINKNEGTASTTYIKVYGAPYPGTYSSMSLPEIAYTLPEGYSSCAVTGYQTKSDAGSNININYGGPSGSLYTINRVSGRTYYFTSPYTADVIRDNSSAGVLRNSYICLNLNLVRSYIIKK